MLTNLYGKSNFSSRLALAATAGCIAAIAGYGWFIKPHIKCLEASQRYANEVGAFAKKSRLMEGKLKLKQIEFDQLSAKIASLQRQFFTYADAQRFLSGLEPRAQRFKCAVVSLKQTADQTTGEEKASCRTAGMTALPFEMSVVGRYCDIISFLKGLGDGGKKISLSSFTLAPYQNSAEILVCSLKLHIYLIEENDKGDLSK